MRGIDIYRGESKDGKSSKLKAIPEKAYRESDFVIVKSTQGASYKYTDFFHNMIKRATKDGKLIGAYHYAAGNDAVKEADYFISVVKPYLGKILLCLDWESYQNKAWGSKTWAKKFVDRVKEKTGITCVLYTGTDGCMQCQNLIGVTPLWFAGYPKPMSKTWAVPKFKYNLGKWKKCDIWQYTSTNEQVDRNTTEWTSLEWRKYASGKSIPTILIDLLKEYNAYIKEHYKNFVNRYDSDMTTFEKAKARVAKGKDVGLTCVVPLRWALANLGLKNGKGLSLISAPHGSFKEYYTGDMKKYLTRITSGGAIGKTVKNAVDAKLLKKGDIVCYEDLTHTSVYSGVGYKMYEGGGACVVDGHYPNGVVKDYSDKYKDRKISEILRWKDQDKSTTKSTTTNNTTVKAGNYQGAFPVLPPRGYFKLNDGITTLVSYRPNIKMVQNLVNWINNGKIAVDGQYGKKTVSAVKDAQKKLGVTQDGLFGQKTLAKCKAYTKK